MGKKSRAKKRRKLQRQMNATAQGPTPKTRRKIWKRIANIAVVVTIVVGIVGFFGGLKPLMDLFRSKREINENDNFAKGKFDPPPARDTESTPTKEPTAYLIHDTALPTLPKHSISSTKPPQIKGLIVYDSLTTEKFYFHIGGSVYGVEKQLLGKGVDNFWQILGIGNFAGLIVKLIGNRIYVSVSFSNLLNDDYIGKVAFQNWEVYIPNTLRWNNDDERLEVRDKQNLIVFSIKYTGKGNIIFGGYFLSPKIVTVMLNTPDEGEVDKFYHSFSKSDTNWKENAALMVKRMVPIFP